MSGVLVHPDGARLRMSEASARGAAMARVRAGLARVAEEVGAEGMPRVEPRGQLIRPLVAYAGVRAGGAPPDGFWEAALAVQLAHEASLVHDDIVDGSAARRGAPTLAAAVGTGAALVHGDHLLTAAYRVAARTGSLPFARLFSRAVERTVAGEVAQGRARGEVLSWDRYREIALGKAGELLGCSLAIVPVLESRSNASAVHELGRRLGLVYQMLDDLLDYCPATDAGKPPLVDFAQGRWTWPLLELDAAEFGAAPEAVAARLRDRAGAGSALRRCLRRLEGEAAEVESGIRDLLGESEILSDLLRGWVGRARTAVEREEAHPPRSPLSPVPSAALRARVPAPDEVTGYLARHSRSFRFAARFFPRAEMERVARVYAFCRVTDDLVDRPGDAPDEREDRLLEWMRFAQRAYEGEPTGLPFLDRVMGEMAAAGVPFTYAAELAEGMRMDLRGERYTTLEALRTYTWRVASVVGLWLTELAGVRDPRVLEHAAALGHAMQLTNILRDVGEDAQRGRIYLPTDLLRRHGVETADLEEMRAKRRPISAGYCALVEELLQAAEGEYRFAFRAIPALPPSFRRPVAVAAHVYRGIHDEIRGRGYDNLRQRAVTSGGTKALLAVRALWELRGLGVNGPTENALAALRARP